MSTNPCEKDRQNQPPIQLESLHNLPFSRRQFTAAPIYGNYIQILEPCAVLPRRSSSGAWRRIDRKAGK
jgi:hypothetical protein